MQSHARQQSQRFLQVAGAAALILFPLILMLAFALHFDSISEFFVFQLRHVPNSAEAFMATLRDPVASQRYSLAHLVGYLDLPLLIAAGLFLGATLYQRRPWVAIIGMISVCTGAIYMGGVFGSWLSFAPIGTVPPEMIPGATAALGAVTAMQGAMLLTTMLSGLGLLGMVILGGGLFFTDLMPRWSSGLIVLGNLLIFVFMDLDNWMLIGALLMLIGGLPLALKVFARPQSGLITQAHPTSA